MKKLLLSLLLIVPLITFNSCGNDDDGKNNDNALVGTVWEYEENDDTNGYYDHETLYFKSGSKVNYTMVEKEYGETVTNLSLEGTYSYNSPKVYVTMTYQGETKTETLTISNNKMVSEDSGYVFSRIK